MELSTGNADALVPPSPTGATAGHQEQGELTAVLTPSVPLELAHVTQVVTGVAAANPRSMGHDFAAQMIAANMRQMDYTINVQRAELTNQLGRLDALKDKVATLSAEKEVLEERLGTKSRLETVRAFSGVIGTWLVTVSIDLWKAQFSLALLALLAGLALVAFGFLGVRSGKKS